MGFKAQADEGLERLIQFEIDGYQAVVDGKAETHRYIYKDTGLVCNDIHMPTGVKFNREIEDFALTGILDLESRTLEDVEYIGAISVEEAKIQVANGLGAIAVVNGPAVIGAYIAWGTSKIAA